MNQKRIILICLLLYIGATLLLFMRNVLFASERISIEKIIEKENIVTADQRSTLRAFYSSPPVIPHEVEDDRNANDCLRCHMDVTKLEDGRVAMQTPHPQFSNCMQCHVPSLASKDDVSTLWEGLEEPKRGDRWFTTSPPTVPHRIYLRENCLSCHGPENPDTRLRTTHPERTSCLQCHVPNYENEF